ncbi:hypothetical protein HJ581_0041310 [Rhodococcus opacus]|uniref:hypothetical protein n=1 Tax=Rhodococcus opacus TaxID=37919 RepID=UPI001469DD12|nr:hypothetical protein [Rhodococcus opacus]MDV7088931.1 hypothetical protein [Rhodococcus opacus]WKN60221.1 hypothetical protein HJ581_0041310 [Rhodococcus opacus]
MTFVEMPLPSTIASARALRPGSAAWQTEGEHRRRKRPDEHAKRDSDHQHACLGSADIQVGCDIGHQARDDELARSHEERAGRDGVHHQRHP